MESKSIIYRLSPTEINIDLLSEIFNVTRDELLKGELNPKPKKKSLFTKKTLITFFLTIIIISITGLFIYHNSKSETYILASANEKEYYVLGNVSFYKNDISVIINKIVFLDRDFNKINIKWFEYELIFNDNVLYRYNCSDKIENTETIKPIKDYLKIFNVNFSQELQYNKNIYLNNPLTLRITFIDEVNNIIVKDIEMNIVPKANTTQEVE